MSGTISSAGISAARDNHIETVFLPICSSPSEGAVSLRSLFVRTNKNTVIANQ